uniref:Uncharacterized protein n=1 Tax=uncultured Nitrospirae bacterium MY4-5C TaxID=798580 RepID=D9MP79_9BACT|nr:hypothetical protein LW5_0100 [uncultured Nitrospirae bacterium MY4-5C]
MSQLQNAVALCTCNILDSRFHGNDRQGKTTFCCNSGHLPPGGVSFLRTDCVIIENQPPPFF